MFFYSCKPYCEPTGDPALKLVFYDSIGQKNYVIPYDSLIVPGYYKNQLDGQDMYLHLNPKSDKTTFVFTGNFDEPADTLTLGYQINYKFNERSKCDFGYHLENVGLGQPTSLKKVILAGNEVQIHY